MRAKYYRFSIGKEQSEASGFPKIVELFARHPEFELAPGTYKTPLPIEDDDVRSLSAIILDEGYFEFLKTGLITVEGVAVPDALHIIPLKMRAHIDNNDLHARGVNIQEKNLTKHRADVIRLSELLPNQAKLTLAGQMKEDAERFFKDVNALADRSPRKEKRRLADIATFLRGVYL